MDETEQKKPTRMPNWFRASTQDVRVVVIAGILAIGFSVLHLVGRLIEVLPNKDVPVEIAPAEQAARLPLGPGGELVEVDAAQVLVTVSDLAPGTYAGVLGASVVGPLATIVVAVLGIGFCRAILRGEVFVPANTLRINLIAAVTLGGVVLDAVFGSLQHNGVLAALAAPDEPAGISARLELVPLFAGLALAAFAVAFNTGEKLRRDTEGLV